MTKARRLATLDSPAKAALSRLAGMDRVLWHRLIAGGAAALAIVMTVRTILTGGDAGCAFSDGRSYCARAQGDPGVEPFTRRPLIPFLVRISHPGDLSLGFRFWALLGLIALAVIVAILTARLTAAVSDARLAPSAAVIAASAMVLMPHGLRLAWVYPVLVDVEAMALGVAWITVLVSRRAQWAPVLALSVVLCREQWVAPVLLVTVFLLFRKQVLNALLHVVVVLVGASVDVLQPHEGAPRTARLSETLGYFFEPQMWWSLIGCGLVVALYLTCRPWRRRLGFLESLLLLTGAVQIVLGALGGSDTPRLLAGSLPFLVPLAVAWVGRTRFGLVRIALVGGLLMEYWRVWRIPSANSYGSLYLPFHNPAARDRVAVELIVAVIAVIALAASRCRDTFSGFGIRFPSPGTSGSESSPGIPGRPGEEWNDAAGASTPTVRT